MKPLKDGFFNGSNSPKRLKKEVCDRLPARRWGNYYTVGTLIFLTLLVYANSLGNPFVWDDHNLIVLNPAVRTLENAWLYFTKDYFIDNYYTGLYRPLVNLSYIVNYHFFGLNTFYYHLFNILIHLGCTLLFYALLLRLAIGRLVAFLSALIFALHPVHTESVTWIAGRTDPMACIFVLGSFHALLSFVQYRGSGRGSFFYLLSLVLFFLSLLCKEVALVFPLALAFYFFIWQGSFSPRLLLPFFGLSAGFLFLKFMVLHKVAPLSDYWGNSFLNNALIMLQVGQQYVKLILFPVRLQALYVFYPPSSFYSLEFIRPLLVLILVAGFGWCLAKIHKRAFFFFAWTAIFLIPVSNLIPLQTEMAERFLYLPSLGFSVLLAGAGRKIYQFLERRNVASLKALCLLSAVAILIGYGVIIYQRNEIWAEPIRFWYTEAKATPIRTSLMNLANSYAAEGRAEEALRIYYRVKRLCPQEAAVDYNIACLFMDQGDYGQAIDHLQEALRINPHMAQASLNLGVAYYNQSRLKEAKGAFLPLLETLAKGKEKGLCYFNLGVIALKEERRQAAKSLFIKAIRANPQMASAYLNLAYLYYKEGKPQKAVILCKEAIWHDPHDIGCRYLLVTVLKEQGEVLEAETQLKVLLRLLPKDNPGFDSLLKMREELSSCKKVT